MPRSQADSNLSNGLITPDNQPFELQTTALDNYELWSNNFGKSTTLNLGIGSDCINSSGIRLARLGLIHDLTYANSILESDNAETDSSSHTLTLFKKEEIIKTLNRSIFHP